MQTYTAATLQNLFNVDNCDATDCLPRKKSTTVLDKLLAKCNIKIALLTLLLSYASVHKLLNYTTAPSDWFEMQRAALQD